MKVEIRSLSSFDRGALQRTYAMMCPERKQRIDRYTHREDRLRSVAGECLAREMLSAFSGLAPCHADIQETASGKPVVSMPDVHFSISHSDQLIACAVEKFPVGVDVERIRPISRDVVQMVCSEREADYIARGVPYSCKKLTGDSLLRFFAVWTAKEAYAKLTGEGMYVSQRIDYFRIEKKVVSFLMEDYFVSVLSCNDSAPILERDHPRNDEISRNLLTSGSDKKVW